jgi:DNA-binding PadR family transcriptional regulator
VPRPPDASRQTLALLRALAGQGRRWRYGYELGKETSLRSGSLYPILMRLAERGLLETGWEPEPPRGRPPRHLYRLTSAGETHLATLEARAGDAGTQPAARRRLRTAG